MNLHDVRSCSWPSKSAGNVRNTLIKKCVFLSIGSFDHESLCKFFALVTTCAELCRLDVFTISVVVDKNQQFSEKPSSIHVLIMSLNHLAHRKFFCVFFFFPFVPHMIYFCIKSLSLLTRHKMYCLVRRDIYGQSRNWAQWLCSQHLHIASEILHIELNEFTDRAVLNKKDQSW